MQYRYFGRTGWQVSEIAVGAWQLGGDWGAVDDDTSIRTLQHAFDRGVNFVDTAYIYGNGHAEEVIGRALRTWSGRKIYVATKAQPVEWPAPDDEAPQMRGRYPAWYLRRMVDDALRRLQLERIDLFQLHSWMGSGLYELDWLETLNALRIEGKIDQIGVSIRDYRPADGVDLARLGLVASQQVVLNLFEQRPAGDLFQAGAGSQGFIARVPLDSGSLVGHWDENTYASFAAGSVPAQLFRGDRLAETLARVRALKTLCAPYYPTLAEAAMRYVLSCPELSCVIPGMLNPEQVDMNVIYSDGAPFPAELKAALAAHVWPRNFYQ
ncbi:aldo/keto reductase [Cypionkella psychrotolerans]|uniref:aldo/keto reductase n=1 Tax=Cypionkella psychrotolerans TaxID=1678131 RepID=UPI0006B5206D|nr:aldo/keto reductase [Cypionkella psychrotolerans]